MKFNETANISKNEDVSRSDVKEKKKKVVKKKIISETFDSDVVNFINEVRTNPPAYALKIEEAIAKIKEEDKDGKLVKYYHDKGFKIAVQKGADVFMSVAEKLKNLSPMEPLEIMEGLAVPVPTDEKLWKDQSTLKQLVTDKKKELGVTEFGFTFEANSDPELSVFLQVVDDGVHGGKRRDNILNPNYRKIGVSHLKSKAFIAYFAFIR